MFAQRFLVPTVLIDSDNKNAIRIADSDGRQVNGNTRVSLNPLFSHMWSEVYIVVSCILK